MQAKRSSWNAMYRWLSAILGAGLPSMRIKSKFAVVFLAVDLAGTFVFAIEGAMTGVRANLDLLGIIVLAFATAVGGGIIRDLLIGDSPPAAIRGWRYPAIAFAGGVAVILFHVFAGRGVECLLVTLDAAGLALLAVSGAEKALEFGIHPFLAIFMGAITGVGGGTIRDILLAKVPAVLRADIYAVAALAGAAVMVLGLQMKLPRVWMAFAGGVFCFVLRMLAVWLHWNLPRVSHY